MEVLNLQTDTPARTQPLRVHADALSYVVYDNFTAAAAIKTQWNDLAARTGDLLCSFDWCEIWWKHFNYRRRLEIHTLHDKDQVVGVLPLFRETIYPAGIWLRTVRVLGCDSTVDTIGLALEPDYARPFSEMLLDRLDQRGSWDILQIAPLRDYATALECIVQTCNQDRRVQTIIHGRQDNWLTMFHLPATFDQFMASLTSKVRSDTRRRQRRLEERHEVEVSAVTTFQQLNDAMDALIRLHQKRWTDRGRSGQLGDLPVQQFHREVAARFAEAGQLAMLVMKVDGEIVSTGYAYRFGNRTHPLMVGHCYDPKWNEYGLGRIMHCHLIRDAIEHGCTEMEDGRGVFEYKMQLGGQLHGERSMVALRSGWSCRLRFWASLRAAYLIHVLYSRIWIDMIVPVLHIRPKSRRFYIINRVFVQIYRQTHLRLFGGPTVIETQTLRQPSRPAAVHPTPRE